MTDNVIARRYAGALFAIGNREGGGAREKRGECLAAIAGMLEAEPKLGLTLKSPVVEIPEKKAVMREILKRMDADQTMRNFCDLLADKNRLGELAGIARCYGNMLDAANGILRGKVTTAINLSPEKRAALKERLKEKIGSDIELAFDVDPEILGGMVLTVGDKALDSSLRAQLAALRETLIRGM